MLYKYINENKIEKEPNYIIYSDMIITNPQFSAEGRQMLLDKGYCCNLVNTPYPDTDDGYYRKSSYKLDGDTITQVWSEPIEIDKISGD